MRPLLIFSLLSIIGMVHSYTTNPEALRNICCQCRTSSLVCNFCFTSANTHACDLTGVTLMNWSVSIQSFIDSHLLPVHISNFASAYGHSYFLRDRVTLSFTSASHSCTRHANTARYLHGNTALEHYNCANVTSDSICTVGPLCSQAIVKKSGDTYFCFSQHVNLSPITWYDINYYYNKIASPVGDCVEADYPSLLSSLKELSTFPPYSVFIDEYDDRSMLLNVKTTEGLYNTYRMLERGLPLAKRKYSDIETFCTDDPYIIDTVFTSPDQKYTWYANIMIIRRGPCSLYVPYNQQEDICADDLLISQYTASCPDTFRPRQFTNQSTIYNISLPVKNSTCDKFKQLFNCGVKDWIDYYINSTSSAGNIDYEDHARLLNEYAEARQSGWFSWIAGVFEPGIKLIFDIFGSNFEDYVITFFEQLLDYILKIVFELFNAIVALFKKSQEFIDKLVQFITQILDVLFSFVAFLLKALIGVLLKVEQHYLLFEYIILFLLVDYYLINNNLFSMIVVLLVMVVVGIDRRSPSILLAFHSLEYSYVNLSGYDPSQFTWDYSLVYHSYGRNKTYNISLPSLPSLAETPHYNTTVERNHTYPNYEIKNQTLNCSSYPIYNISSYFIHHP